MSRTKTVYRRRHRRKNKAALKHGKKAKPNHGDQHHGVGKYREKTTPSSKNWRYRKYRPNKPITNWLA